MCPRVHDVQGGHAKHARGIYDSPVTERIRAFASYATPLRRLRAPCRPKEWSAATGSSICRAPGGDRDAGLRGSGRVHPAVFAGFAADELAQRLQDTGRGRGRSSSGGARIDGPQATDVQVIVLWRAKAGRRRDVGVRRLRTPIRSYSHSVPISR